MIKKGTVTNKALATPEAKAAGRHPIENPEKS